MYDLSGNAIDGASSVEREEFFVREHRAEGAIAMNYFHRYVHTYTVLGIA